jgi:hypothetical protein
MNSGTLLRHVIGIYATCVDPRSNLSLLTWRAWPRPNFFG